MNEQDVRKLLALTIGSHGSQYQFATRFKLSPAYVNDILHGRRMPGKGMLKALGLKRVVAYEFTKDGR